ncbi:MAG: PIN domain-containing protein [Candidatus Dojkabacteria bacterium]
MVDTSFVSSFFNSEDINHSKALQLAKSIYSEYIIVPSVVIAELSTSFSKNEDFTNLILENVFDIASEIFPLDESNIFDYLAFQKDRANNLKALDSIILYSALVSDAELLTFDKKLKRKYKDLI